MISLSRGASVGSGAMVMLGGQSFTEAAPFSPADITGLAAWYDADDLSTFTFGIGTAVSEWRDKSGNARHELQAVAINRPSRVAGAHNGRAAVRFGGVTAFLRNSGFTLTQPNTVFVVGLANGSPQTFFDSAGALPTFIQRSGAFRMSAGVILAGATPNSSLHRHRCIFNGASSSIALDGGAPTSGNAGTNAINSGITLGANNAGTPGALLNGDLCEVLVYNALLSTADRDEVESYLADKWGL